MNFTLLHLYYLNKEKQRSVVEKLSKHNIEAYFSEDKISKNNVDFLFVGAQELNSIYLKQFTNLKFIQILGNNTSLADLEYCNSNNIQVSTTQYPRGYIIAEHAIALALNFTRNLALANKTVRKHQLKNGENEVTATEVNGVDNWCNIPSSTLYNATIGIIGFGAIGLELNKRLQAFGCKVSYFKRNQYSSNIENNLNITYKPLNEIIKSDIIFIHLGLNNETKNLINEELLAKVHKNAIIINCGRAAVIKENSFIKLLQNNPTMKAGLDVFWKEPLSSTHELTLLQNVILTPHMAECGGEDISKQRIEALDKIIRFSNHNN